MINGYSFWVHNEKETAERLCSTYKQYMSMDDNSQTIADLKKKWFRTQQSFSFYHMLSKVKGYASGAAQVLTNNLPELGLAAVAIATRKFNMAGKIAAGILTLKGIKSICVDVIGIGK